MNIYIFILKILITKNNNNILDNRLSINIRKSMESLLV